MNIINVESVPVSPSIVPDTSIPFLAGPDDESVTFSEGEVVAVQTDEDVGVETAETVLN